MHEQANRLKNRKYRVSQPITTFPNLYVFAPIFAVLSVGFPLVSVCTFLPTTLAEKLGIVRILLGLGSQNY